MSKRETFNFWTGLISFIVWIWLSYLYPEHTFNLALASLMMLLGFGGRDTIVEIVKTWKGTNDV